MQVLVGLVTVLAFSMNLFAQAPFTVFEKSINEIQEALEKVVGGNIVLKRHIQYDDRSGCLM